MYGPGDKLQNHLYNEALKFVDEYLVDYFIFDAALCEGCVHRM